MNQGKDSDYSPGLRALTRSMHFVFIVLTTLIIGMFIYIFTFGGFFVVQPQEVILVLRFGKMEGIYEEDWHWIYPYPIDEKVRIPTSKLKLNTDLFWPQKNIKGFDEAPGAAQGGPLIPGKDGYLLTGDANIIHTQWELIYQIVNPGNYYRNCLCPTNPKKADETLVNPKTGEKLGMRGPRTLLRTILENTILKVTASEKVENALYKNSFQYMKKVQSEFVKTINNMEIGVAVDNIILKKKNVPAKTQGVFRSVIAAEQESGIERDKAKKFAVEMKNQTNSDESQIIAEAIAYKKMVVAQVQAETDYFNRIFEEYTKSEDANIILVTLYNEALAQVLSSVKEKFVIRNNSKIRQQVWLKMNPEPKLPKKAGAKEGGKGGTQ